MSARRRRPRAAPETRGATAEEAREGGSLRAFLALEIAPAMRERIAELMGRLALTVAGVRWVRPEGIHITLRFLGWTTPDVLAEVQSRVKAAAAACSAGEARVAGLGLFPDRGAPRVLWLGVSMPESMFALQETCEAAAVAAGFEAETRPFRSHLTLGRWREHARRPVLPDVDLGVMPLDRLVFVRSQLHPKGAIYTPLASFPFEG